MMALSIRQPWAWLIANGHKDIENRCWKTLRRETIYIHASKGMTRGEYDDALKTCELVSAMSGEAITLPPFEDLERGGIIGTVEIAGCVNKHPSPWFFGEFGFILENAKPLPFRPYRGALGFFNVESEAP
jgi:hypothetical protein